MISFYIANCLLLSIIAALRCHASPTPKGNMARSPILPITGPGPVVDTSFENIPCASNVTEPGLSATDRWTYAQGDLAVQEMSTSYTFDTTLKSSVGGRYDNFASVYLKGPAGGNLDCGIQDSDCNTGPSVQCSTGMYAAGWEILTSFTSLDHVSSTCLASYEHTLTISRS